MHKNANSMPRRSCHSDHCKYCDRYERRYSPDTIADLTKIAYESGAVRRITSKKGETGGDREVTLPYIGNGNDVVTPNEWGDCCFTLPCDGTIQKHVGVSYVDQDKDPEYNGPYITDDIHDFARKHLNISSESMKRRYGVKIHKIPYKVGDAVWYYYPKRKVGFNPKFQRPWKGPMIVVDRFNEVLCRIQSGPKTKPMVVHHDKLKPI